MGARGRFLVHLGDASFEGDLRRHFERTGFAVRRAAEGALEIEAEAREAVERHLQLWLLMNPAGCAYVTEAP